MNPFSKLFRRGLSTGFTAVELIATLLILGVLAAVIIPKANTEEPQVINDLNVLRAHIRFAQLKAMGDITPWGLNIGATSYTLERNGTTAAMVNLPGDNSATHTFDASALTVTPVRIAFDPRGRPFNMGTRTVMNSDQTINVVPTDYKDIVITQQTGFLK